MFGAPVQLGFGVEVAWRIAPGCNVRERVNLCGKNDSGRGGPQRLATMEFMQAFQLIVHRHQLVADMDRILNPGEIVQHRLNLCLASDQDAALGGSWFVGHGGVSLVQAPPTALHLLLAFCRNRSVFQPDVSRSGGHGHLIARNSRKTHRIEGGAANEHPIDVRLDHQLVDGGRVH
jgi:hypothetical protein